MADSSPPVRSTRPLVRAATGPAAMTVYVAVGVAGLAALAVAIIGPRRIQRRVIRPASLAVADQAERIWAETRPLRTQLGQLVDSVQSPAARDRLVRNLQSWIGHFRAD